MSDARRNLPSVNTLLESEGVKDLLTRAHRRIVVDAVRAAVDSARNGSVPSSDAEWLDAITRQVDAARRSSLQIVINATGVVLHTNLGRAVMAAEAISAIIDAASGYTNLEYDLNAGERGSRYVHCVSLLRELTGAEDALVVNNNAAAIVLALNTLAPQRDVIISRGELVEIGGSFRVPDIMERSTARLVEVGTTNRTHAADYEAAIGANTGALLKVHRSNFAMEGFVAEVDTRDLAAISRKRSVPLIHDLGSGLMIPLDSLGLTGEPTVADVVKAGASIVTMSGDKLLGGPQAGIIVGSAPLVQAIRKNPLLRAFRADKMTIAALEATLTLYRDPAQAMRRIPTLQLLGFTADALRKRAEAICGEIDGGATVVDCKSTVGGGAFPSARIPSAGVSVSHDAKRVEDALRHNEPAIIGRMADGALVLDLRCVHPPYDALIAAALKRALKS